MAHWDGFGWSLGRLWRHLSAPRGIWERFRGHFGTSFGSIFDEKLDKSDAKCGVLLFGHIFQRIAVFFLVCPFFKAWRHCVFHAKTSVFIMYTRCPPGWSFSNFHCHFGHTFRCFFSKSVSCLDIFRPKRHLEDVRKAFDQRLRSLWDVLVAIWGPWTTSGGHWTPFGGPLGLRKLKKHLS